jgi:hypothetical protein
VLEESPGTEGATLRVRGEAADIQRLQAHLRSLPQSSSSRV